MTASCVLGAQWGDEGKGKIIDLLAERADVVARFAGGNNAGHTVVIGERKFAVHLLPSGVFRDGVRNVLGGGVVIDPWELTREIAQVVADGVSVEPGRNLLISRSAHLILPLHRMQDRIMEELRGAGKIGTTGRGIGPAYQDRASRAGIRFGDLEDRAGLESKLHAIVAEKNRFLASHDFEPIDPKALLDDLLATCAPLEPAACDGGRLLRDAIAAGERVLFEGAQGLMLDVDLGTYPYVTSCSVGLSGIGGGAAVSPRAVGEVILVAKAYTTRVGEGPFPTELSDATGARIREQGNEFGTTTGRPRRCGWIDAVALRYAVDVSSADALYLTNLDVLTGIPRLRVGIGYTVGGVRHDVFPAGLAGLDSAEVEYAERPGWDADITAVRRFDDLPEAARDYVGFIESRLDTAIPLISVGPERDQVIRRNDG